MDTDYETQGDLTNVSYIRVRYMVPASIEQRRVDMTLHILFV